MLHTIARLISGSPLARKMAEVRRKRRAMRRLARNPQQNLHSEKPLSPLLGAFIEARAVGGTISESDLVRIFDAGSNVVSAFCLGSEREVLQMALMLRAAGVKMIGSTAEVPIISRRGNLDEAELIIVEPSAQREYRELLQSSRRLQGTLLELTTERAKQSRSAISPKRNLPRSEGLSLRKLLELGQRVKVVLLNDVGFQYGAGVAVRRQAAAFLQKGWEVTVVCWSAGARPMPVLAGAWNGIHACQSFHRASGMSDTEIVRQVVNKVMTFEPDLVVVGNLHGADWPLDILRVLRDLGKPVVAYMHDCYLVTGRCAYPGPCSRYATGCDEACPTPHEYPALEPKLISTAWRSRAALFAGADPIPLVANSRWTRNVAYRRFGSPARLEVVHLGLDHHLFAPIDRSLARRLLAIPDDKPVILLGAVNVEDPRKGGPFFKELHASLLARSDLYVVIFGHQSQRLPARLSLGPVSDERLMPIIYAAADIFVGTATEEAFGQTLMEASACAVPVVAFNVGGIAEIVDNGRTGLLLSERTSESLRHAIDALLADPNERQRLGQNGRKAVMNGFTLDRHSSGWVECLRRFDLGG